MTASALLTGEKNRMEVDLWGQKRSMLVQPEVTTTEEELGISVKIFEVENPEKPIVVQFWGLVIPHDLIACWRGMLILQGMRVLEMGDLCNAFYAGLRNPHESDRHRIDEVVTKIGRDAYDAIMARPVPNEVSDLLFKLASEDKHFALWAITDEVRAGTLKWSDDFARIGILHPQQVADREAAEKQVFARYESHLGDYAKNHGFERECLIMWSIEEAIVEAVEKGIEAHHGEDIALGIAIVRAIGATASFTAAVLELENEEGLTREITEGIRQTATWVFSHFKTGWFIKMPKRSQKKYVSIMQKLNDDWPNMPVTHPLTA